MRGKTANWWLPDDVVFVDEIPHTATGKIQKMALRETYKDYVLPSVAEPRVKHSLSAPAKSAPVDAGLPLPPP